MSNWRAPSRGASGGVAVTPSMSASSIVAKAASGSHVLKIDGYSRTKGLGCGKFITSRSFVVGGHRWCLRYYPDSHYEKLIYSFPWISILLCLDPSEAGEVRAQFKISLLDKEGHPVPRYVWNNNKCFTFSGKREPPVSGLFIEKAKLESLPYLKDDCFSVRCDITVVMEIITEDLVVPAVERGIKKET
ncbi:BTB/POZ and MATH domain-containing protein 2-like [Hordeum vulgare]|nr:BTB/POZ and MATH domain-containing protein 2-like [Hordeum vulgare]